MKEDILDKYALNQLNSEDKKWIKNAVAIEPSFQQELDLHKNIVQALIKKGAEENNNANLKVKINQIDEVLEQEGFFDKGIDKELIQGLQLKGEEELFQKIQLVDNNLEKEGFFETPKSQSKIKLIGLFAAAASLLFLLNMAWHYSTSSTIDYQQEYAIVFEHPENALSKAVQMELSEQGFGGNPDETALQEILTAMEAYDNKKYIKAVDLLEKALESTKITNYKDRIKIYLGLSYLESGKVDKAILQFQNLSSNEGANQVVARWYLALAYLKVKKVKKTRIILEQLKNSKLKSYQKKATVKIKK